MAETLSDETGLSPVVSVDRDSCRADLVFVHGLGGGAQTTWAAEGKPENFWPEWLGSEFPDLSIWTLGYHSSVSAWVERSMPLADLGNQILEELCVEGIGSRPIVFVTHSMGGLVVKQIISHARSQGVERWKKIAQMTRGVAFLATPHTGANLANFAEFARVVLRPTKQVDDLTQHSSRLRELNGGFLNFVNEQKTVCRTYAERREVKPGVKIFKWNVKIPKGILVVDETSAEPNIPGERAIPLDEDHISICKPTDTGKKVYRYIRSFIRECLDGPPAVGVDVRDGNKLQTKVVQADEPNQARVNAANGQAGTDQAKNRFSVALSFPGEHREFVLEVAESLASSLTRERVFYDKWHEVKLLGSGGDLKLQSMYENADLVVPFFSEHYSKPWCEMEWETIRGILLDRREDDAVIPVHLDSTKIPGWSTVNFGIRLEGRSAQQVAKVILEALSERTPVGTKVKEVLSAQKTDREKANDGGPSSSKKEDEKTVVADESLADFDQWLAEATKMFCDIFLSMGAACQKQVAEAIGLESAVERRKLEKIVRASFDRSIPEDSDDTEWFDQTLIDLEAIEVEPGVSTDDIKRLRSLQDIMFQLGFPRQRLSGLAKKLRSGGALVTEGSVATHVLAELSTAFASRTAPKFISSDSLGVVGQGMLHYVGPPLGDPNIQGLVEHLLRDLAGQLSVNLDPEEPTKGSESTLEDWAAQLNRAMKFYSKRHRSRNELRSKRPDTCCRFYCVIAPPEKETDRQRLIDILEVVNGKIRDLAFFILERRASSKGSEEIVLQILKARFSEENP